MRFPNLVPLLFLAPASFLYLTSQPSYAAEYSFEFISDGFLEFGESLGELQDPDDDVFFSEFIPGPLSLGNGSLSIDDDEVMFGGTQSLLFSELGSSADFDFSFSVPTNRISTPTVTPEDIKTPVEFTFSEGDLVAVSFFAISELLGGGGRTTELEVLGPSFSFVASEGIPSISFGGRAVGDGSIRFEKIDSEPTKAVPEPTTIVGMIAAFSMTVAARRKFSA